MGSGAGLLVAAETSRFWTFRDNHEGDGAALPKRETPSTADGGTEAVRERGSTKLYWGSRSCRDVEEMRGLELWTSIRGAGGFKVDKSRAAGLA